MLKKRFLILLVSLLFIFTLSLFLGSSPPSLLYYLKIGRETIQSFFIFGQEDRANWLLIRAEKRIAEAEDLNARGWEFFSLHQKNTAEAYQLESEGLLKGLKDKANITYLLDKQAQNNDRLKVLNSK